MNEHDFKKQFRTDQCTNCPKRQPCAETESICPLVTPCAVCEIRDECTSLCDQMKSYLSRGNQKVLPTVPFNLSPKMEEHFSFLHLENEKGAIIEREKLTMKDIPWKAISDIDAKVIKEHFLFGKSYEEISKEYNIPVTSIFETIRGGKKAGQGALNILREFAEYQRLIKKFGRFLSTQNREILVEYYCNYKSIEELKKIDETKRAVYYRLKKAKKLLYKFTEME